MTEEPILRGQRMQAVLTDPIFVETVESLRADLFAEWCSSADVEARERLHGDARALDRLLTKLQSVVDDGVHAKASRHD